MAAVIPDEVGQRYDAGIVSSAFGSAGLFIKPGTFHKDLQSQLRDEVIASATASIVDRDIAFWKRQSQVDWSQGEGQDYFTNPSRYSQSWSLDAHNPGELRMVPMPTRLRQQTGALNGRGGVYCKQRVFLPWVDGFYTYIDNGLTSNLAISSAGAAISDICSDGSTVFFTFTGLIGVYQTPGATPNTLIQYDSPGSVYGRMAYNQLTKQLFASTGAVTSLARLDKINAGGAATVIYDFLTGRIDALEMHQGNLIIAWNDSSGFLGSTGYIGKSRLFKYDGTNVTPYVDLPDGCMVVGMKSALGILFVMCAEDDVLDEQNLPKPVHTVYFVTSSTVGKLGNITDAVMAADAGSSLYPIGSLTMALALGQSVYFPATGHTWRYDTALGGLSRSLGDDGVPALSSSFAAARMPSLAYMSSGGVICLINGVGNTGGVFNLHGTIFGIRPSNPSGTACRLISSRIDAGLPYVNKFWYALETIFDPLISGDSIEMEYSSDDGTTWVACTGSPFTTVGAKSALFLMQIVSAHIRYRVKLIAGVTSKGPVIHAISPRYAVVNANASVYRMTVMGYDQIKGRGNVVDQPGYGKDTLAFLDQIARDNKLITFYEPDDSDRTPHTCWVMQMSRAMANTGSVYDPRKQEGDVELVLWEAA